MKSLLPAKVFKPLTPNLAVSNLSPRLFSGRVQLMSLFPRLRVHSDFSGDSDRTRQVERIITRKIVLSDSFIFFSALYHDRNLCQRVCVCVCVSGPEEQMSMIRQKGGCKSTVQQYMISSFVDEALFCLQH